MSFCAIWAAAASQRTQRRAGKREKSIRLNGITGTGGERKIKLTKGCNFCDERAHDGCRRRRTYNDSKERNGTIPISRGLKKKKKRKRNQSDSTHSAIMNTNVNNAATRGTVSNGLLTLPALRPSSSRSLFHCERRCAERARTMSDRRREKPFPETCKEVPLELEL